MLFAKSQASYIKKLWNGEYFRYDTASEYRDNIQADQLAGQWYANMTGLGDIIPRDMQLRALKKIFDFNVMKFADGAMGAVNGIAADGSLVKTNEQVQEVWTGTTFGLAAFMLSDGMKDEGYQDRLGHLSHHLRDQGLLVPHSRSLGHHWQLPRLDVHASCGNLGYGNDPPGRQVSRGPLSPAQCVRAKPVS